MRLRDIAAIITTPKKDYKLQDTDILICRAGKNLGGIFYNEERKERLLKAGYVKIYMKYSIIKKMTSKYLQKEKLYCRLA